MLTQASQPAEPRAVGLHDVDRGASKAFRVAAARNRDGSSSGGPRGTGVRICPEGTGGIDEGHGNPATQTGDDLDAHALLSGEPRAVRIRRKRLVSYIEAGADLQAKRLHRPADRLAMHTFLASVRREEAELDRVLATVMFTDIVGPYRCSRLMNSPHSSGEMPKG